MTAADDAASRFEAAYAVVGPVGGWLTRDQARVLHDAVRALGPSPTVVEVGSHRGRSTLALALARPDVTVVAIDPFVEGWKFGGARTRAEFEANTAVVADRVRLLARPSDDVRVGWHAPVDLVFVDGKHDALSTWGDLRWSRHLPAGGTVLVHDAFSSLGVTLALLPVLLLGRRLAYRGRTGTLARLEVAAPTRADRAAVLRELPWWGRNLVVKVLLRLRLRPVARLLGHHDSWDPY